MHTHAQAHAHTPQVQEVLLRIIDEGRLTDSQGRQASFESAFVIYTLLNSPRPQQQQQQQHQQQNQQQTSTESIAIARRDDSAVDNDLSSSCTGSSSSDGGGSSSTMRATEQQAEAMAYSSDDSGSDTLASDKGAGSPPLSSSEGFAASRRPLPAAVLQLLGLVDATVSFAPLGRDQLSGIVTAQLEAAAAQAARSAGTTVRGSVELVGDCESGGHVVVGLGGVFGLM
jgi:hypothetical protein